jgi:hypothetical protein
MAAGALVVALDCRLYHDATGANSPTWVATPKIGDMTLALPRESATVPERGSEFLKSLVGQIDAEFSFVLNRRPGDTAYDAFRAAHLARTDIGLCICTGDRTVADEEEFVGDFKVTGWEAGAPAAAGASTVNVTCKLSATSTFAPLWQDTAGA